jgi:dipeptidyl aminopeptidase/acylaminoacyl peptidase
MVCACAAPDEVDELDDFHELAQTVDVVAVDDWRLAHTFEDSDIVVEGVLYESDGVAVFGQVCRPNAPGPHPVVVHNHGGFQGLNGGLEAGDIPEWQAPEGSMCRFLADEGYVAVQPSYRGEDGSMGTIEVCNGEADDSIRMLEIVLGKSYADTNRVAMRGASHGGCVTLRAVQKGAPVHAAVAAVPPTNWGALVTFWPAQGQDYALYMGADEDTRNAVAGLAPMIEAFVGGTASEVWDEYVARSPTYHRLPAGPAVLLVHGALDPIIPVSGSCEAAVNFGSAHNYRVAADGSPVHAAAEACADHALTWSAGKSAQWPDLAFGVYDGAAHGYDTPMLADAMDFIAANLSMPRWPR